MNWNHTLLKKLSHTNMLHLSQNSKLKTHRSLQKTMVLLQLNSHNATSILFSKSHHYSNINSPSSKPPPNHLNFKKLRALQTLTNADESDSPTPEEPQSQAGDPAVNFAFVSSVLLPDGTPDVHYRAACGGQKLRDIMLDNNMELYGPYSRPLLNCGGGGTCATCLVEVVQGRELLSPRTQKEKEKLKRKPKNWRLACQATVGRPDSRGLVVIQQLPEWKAHEWTYGKDPPQEDTVYI